MTTILAGTSGTSSQKEQQRRKKLRADLRAKQRDAMKAALPLSEEQLGKLLEYLAGCLPEKPCDHDLGLSINFIRKNQLESGKVLAWIGEHGSRCDCEALMNLPQIHGQITHRQPLTLLPDKLRRENERATSSDLEQEFGFTLDSQRPWPIRFGRKPNDGAFVLRLGKRNSRYLVFFLTPPPTRQETDEVWIQA